MAGHNKRQGIGVAGLSHRPGSPRIAQRLSQFPVSFRFSVRNFGNTIPDASLEFGALFHKWRSGLWRKIPAALLRKFPKKIGTLMAFGAACYAQEAEMFFKPLFCQLMFFLGEGEVLSPMVMAWSSSLGCSDTFGNVFVWVAGVGSGFLRDHL